MFDFFFVVLCYFFNRYVYRFIEDELECCSKFVNSVVVLLRYECELYIINFL